MKPKQNERTNIAMAKEVKKEIGKNGDRHGFSVKDVL